MRAPIILLSMILSFSASAGQDLDNISACTVVKDAKKRLACFDKTVAEAVTARKAAELARQEKAALEASQPRQYNLRGLQCTTLEFAELDSLQARELENMYCSYAKGHSTVNRLTQEAVEKTFNSTTKEALLRQGLRDMEACSRALTKAGDLLRRKFPDYKPDCKLYEQSVQAGAESPK